jgi:hypothetical protein
MYYGLKIMPSKSIICIALRSSLSFMFNDFEIVNLAPRHI